METVKEPTLDATFTLPNKVLKLKPVKKVKGKNGEIHLKHEANFLFGSAKITISPNITKNGMEVNPLTPEERKFFENSELSGLSFQPGDLAVNKKENNFWKSKEARIRLGEETTNFDLSNPYELFKNGYLT